MKRMILGKECEIDIERSVANIIKNEYMHLFSDEFRCWY